jgi:hypothetical protein
LHSAAIGVAAVMFHDASFFLKLDSNRDLMM